MHLKEQQHFKDLIDRIPYKGRYSGKDKINISWDFKCDGLCCKASLSNEFLYKRFAEAGSGAINKVVPASILSAPKNIQKAFLEGYMYGDGSFSGGYYTAQALNMPMIYGLRHLVLRVYEEVASVRYTVLPPTMVIRGRTVNQRNRYDISWKLDKVKEALSYKVNGLSIVKIKTIEKLDAQEPVYNLSVEGDNSYTVGAGYAVHNCQDFSTLNRMSLRDRGLSGEKSSLFMVALDILNHVRASNPGVLFVAENVKGSSILSEYLRVEPVEINNLEFACSSRPRLFFTNIAAEVKIDIFNNIYYKKTIPDSLKNSNITLVLDNPSLDEPSLWVKDSVAEKFFSHPLTVGRVLRDGFPMQTGCMSRGRDFNKFGFSWVYQHGHYRYHTEGELRQMHSIPDYIVFPNKSIRATQDLIGGGWAIGSAKYILQHLPF